MLKNVKNSKSPVPVLREMLRKKKKNAVNLFFSLLVVYERENFKSNKLRKAYGKV